MGLLFSVSVSRALETNEPKILLREEPTNKAIPPPNSANCLFSISKVFTFEKNKPKIGRLPEGQFNLLV